MSGTPLASHSGMITRNTRRLGLVAVAIGLVLLGVVGFVLLRPFAPRSPAPAPEQSKTSTLSLSVVPVPAQQGGKMSLSGKGFAPGETIVIRAAQNQDGSANVQLAQTRASSQGTIRLDSVALPDDLYSGTHRLEAVGQISGRRAATTLYVHAKAPWINVSSYSVKQNARFGLIIGGFQPHERVQVTLEPAAHLSNGQSQDPSKLSKAVTLMTIPTDAVGNAVWSETVLPLLRPGGYTVVARGLTSGKKLTSDLIVEALTPVVELSPWSGPPGTKVELNARGFAPGERVQMFLGPASTATLTVTADRYGNFWGAGPVRIPYGENGGALPLRFVGEQSSAEVTMSFQVLDTRPWLDLSAWSGPPGAPVSFSGGGWAADERVTIHLGSSSGPMVADGQANEGGWLQLGGTGSVPGDARDTVTFVAVGQQSHATASASFKVVNPFDNLPQNLPQNLPPLPQQNPP
jgi:hypothetical protein